MSEFLSNHYLLLAITFAVFVLAKYLHRRTGYVLLNPILITIAVIILFLSAFDISYDTYREGGKYIEFWLKPAVVALGVPLYLQLEQIKRQLLPILVSQLVGCVAGVVSVVFFARLFEASHDVLLSLVAKSVTTPIAMEVTESLGGIPSLTAAVVVCVGIFGGMTGSRILQLSRIENTTAQGLAFGAAAHAVGTDTAMQISQLHGAFASLAMIINGLLTSVLAPIILRLMNVSF